MRISDWSSDVCSSDLQIVDRGEDRIERVLVARQDHPARQRARAAGVERVEGEIDHLTRVLVYGARAQRGFADRARDRARHPLDQRVEESRGGKECVRTCRARRSQEHYKNKTANPPPTKPP